MRAAMFPPMHDHPGLRESEGEKSAYGVERDQTVGDAAERDEKDAAKQRQDDDAVRIHETPAAITEDVRQIIILCDSAAETREIGEGSVGGERKNEKNGGDGQIVENTFAENGADEHGEKALIARLPRIRCRDAVNLHEIRNSSQQDSQDKDNYGESALRVLHGRLAEGFNTVADGFDAGERGAAAGESFEEQPVTDGFGDGRRRRKRSYRRWMSVAQEDAEKSCGDGDEQRADKEICGDCEDHAGFAHAAKIDDGDEDQNAHAHRSGVRQQRRNG